MSNIDTSKWEEFRLCDLFEKIQVEKIKGKANDFPTERSSEFYIPLLTAGADNQGLARYAKREDCPTILRNVISISANGTNTGITFYQDEEFAVLQDAYAIKLINRDISSKEVGLFLAASINKAIKDNHDWSNKAGWNNIKEDKILLPVDENAWVPDWEFMERYIAELEEERVAELDAYLKVCGLNNYELDDKEKAALCMSDEKYIEKYVGKVIWKKVRIGDIFTSQSGDFDIKKEHINGKGVQVVSSGVADRGIIGRTDIKAREFESQSLTVDMFGNVFYRDEPYKMVTHARVFSLLSKINIDDKIGEYLETKLKFLDKLFEYNNMCSFKKIQDLEIELPYDEDGNLHKIYIYIYTSYRKNGHQGSNSLERPSAYDLAKDCVNWKEFRIGDLFSQRRGKEPSPNKAEDGTIPMINETSSNNGLTKYGYSEHVLPGNAITISVNYATTVFYQPKDFIASVNILAIYNDKLNEKNAQFIASILRKSHAIYDYNHKISKDRLNDEIIKLPATPDGSPNFDYMEKYIRAIEKLTIKGVVEWKDREIEKTKTFIL